MNLITVITLNHTRNQVKARKSFAQLLLRICQFDTMIHPNSESSRYLLPSTKCMNHMRAKEENYVAEFIIHSDHK